MSNTSITWHTRVDHCIAVEKKGVKLGIVVLSDDETPHLWTVLTKVGDAGPESLMAGTLQEALQAGEQYALEWLNAG